MAFIGISMTISIHALRGESDPQTTSPQRGYLEFQSTLSEGRATKHLVLESHFVGISIHALRGESDSRHGEIAAEVNNFNPRSPRGERLPAPFSSTGANRFQSTLSEGRATGRQDRGGTGQVISIHALRGESDQSKVSGDRHRRRISIHALRGESDREAITMASMVKLFQSTLSEGRATANISKMLRGGLDRFPNF